MIKRICLNQIPVCTSTKILLLGYTFKENCPDIRNTKVDDIVQSLLEYSIYPTIYDPWITDSSILPEHVSKFFAFDINCLDSFDAIIMCVAHDEFVRMSISEYRRLLRSNSVIFDIKGIVPKCLNPIRL